MGGEEGSPREVGWWFRLRFKAQCGRLRIVSGDRIKCLKLHVIEVNRPKDYWVLCVI